MKIAEIIVSASGGVYTEEVDMLFMLPKNLLPREYEAKFKKGSEESTGFSKVCVCIVRRCTNRAMTGFFMSKQRLISAAKVRDNVA